jgi:hypothetical protein
MAIYQTGEIFLKLVGFFIMRHFSKFKAMQVSPEIDLKRSF